MSETLPVPTKSLFSHWVGPRWPKILLVGEAWGEAEDATQQPFVGSSGQELWRMLGEAMPEIEPELHRHAAGYFRYGYSWIAERLPWLEAAGIAYTNVFNLRPPGNNIGQLCGPKPLNGPSLPPLSSSSQNFPLGRYLRPEFYPELERLWTQIYESRPNLVVALGNTACWATLQATNIGSIRGSVAYGRKPAFLGPEGPRKWKVLPTYHPAMILRNWSARVVTVADLMKAHREGQFPELRRPARQVHISPSIDEVWQWVNKVLYAKPTPQILGVDIETKFRQIEMVGFASSRSEALVIPFIDQSKPDWSYWDSQGEEFRAWQAVQALLECPIPKLFQNGVYDLQYLMRMPFRPRAVSEDTMLFHHSLFPELQKGLGFLGSIYTSEASWKLMRRKKADTVKRDE